MSVGGATFSVSPSKLQTEADEIESAINLSLHGSPFSKVCLSIAVSALHDIADSLSLVVKGIQDYDLFSCSFSDSLSRCV